MIYNTCNKDAYLTGEILAAGWYVGVKKPKGGAQRGQTIAAECPVCNGIVNVFGTHVVNVLWVILPADIFFHASKLTGLKDDISNVSPPYAGIFAAGGMNAVHDNTCHSTHAVISLAAGFTLNKPCQQLSV